MDSISCQSQLNIILKTEAPVFSGALIIFNNVGLITLLKMEGCGIDKRIFLKEVIMKIKQVK